MSKFLIIFAITLAAATVIQAYPQAQEAIRQPKLFLRIKGNPFNEEYYNAGINKNHFFSEYQDFPLDFCGGYNYIFQTGTQTNNLCPKIVLQLGAKYGRADCAEGICGEHPTGGNVYVHNENSFYC